MPWANRLYQKHGQLTRCIHYLAKGNPAEVERIRRECTPPQVATAYAFAMTETEGWGYYFPE